MIHFASALPIFLRQTSCSLCSRPCSPPNKPRWKQEMYTMKSSEQQQNKSWLVETSWKSCRWCHQSSSKYLSTRFAMNAPLKDRAKEGFTWNQQQVRPLKIGLPVPNENFHLPTIEIQEPLLLVSGKVNLSLWSGWRMINPPDKSSRDFSPPRSWKCHKSNCQLLDYEYREYNQSCDMGWGGHEPYLCSSLRCLIKIYYVVSIHI